MYRLRVPWERSQNSLGSGNNPMVTILAYRACKEGVFGLVQVSSPLTGVLPSTRGHVEVLFNMLQPSSNLFPRLFGGCNPGPRVATANDVFFTLYLPKLFKNTDGCIFFWLYFSRVDAHVSYTLFQDEGCSSNTLGVMYFNIMTLVGRVLTLRIQVRSVKQRHSQGFPW